MNSVQKPGGIRKATAVGFTCAAGLVPAEYTFSAGLNDCRKPWAIWLRQLLPVQRIRILIGLCVLCRLPVLVMELYRLPVLVMELYVKRLLVRGLLPCGKLPYNLLCGGKGLLQLVIY